MAKNEMNHQTIVPEIILVQSSISEITTGIGSSVADLIAENFVADDTADGMARPEIIFCDDNNYVEKLLGKDISSHIALVDIEGTSFSKEKIHHTCFLLNKLGVQRIVLAINSLDQTEEGRDAFNGCLEQAESIRESVADVQIDVFPLPAGPAQNGTNPVHQFEWYEGTGLADLLRNRVPIPVEGSTPVAAGDFFGDETDHPDAADQLAAHVIWTSDEEMLPERPYIAKFSDRLVGLRITDLAHVIDADSMDQLAGKTLKQDEIGYCKIALDETVAFDPYLKSPTTGHFQLLDKFTNDALGIGLIDFALRRATNIKWHDMKVDKKVRAKTNDQKPCVLWFTGLSGSGKSTIADALEQKLHQRGKRTYLLDGDNIRHGINKDLGFTDHDRVENIRRVAEISKLMVDAGLIVITSFISPFRSERRLARGLMEEGEFYEIFVNTPLDVCEARDPKGLYKKARAGELKNFTGIDSDYELPELADLTLQSAEKAPDELADEIIIFLDGIKALSN